MSTIVISGVDGFVGRHVVDAVLDAGHSAWGIAREPISDERLRARLQRVAVADLTAEWPEGFFGDAVVHLAGLAAVGPSFDAPQEYITGNSSMVTHLGEAALRSGRDGLRVIGVSSGSVYAGGSPHPLTETSPTAPTSPYVVSKLLVETQFAYYRTRGLRTTIVRPFNHVGPGQRPGFLIPDLVRRLCGLQEGSALAVGNLDARRDYTDVRDVARAYVDLALLDDSQPLYNVASGRSRSGREILEMVCTALGRPLPPLEVDPAFIRPNDPAEVVGDASLLRATGWEPRTPLERSIEDFVASAV